MPEYKIVNKSGKEKSFPVAGSQNSSVLNGQTKTLDLSVELTKAFIKEQEELGCEITRVGDGTAAQGKMGEQSETAKEKSAKVLELEAKVAEAQVAVEEQIALELREETEANQKQADAEAEARAKADKEAADAAAKSEGKVDTKATKK